MTTQHKPKPAPKQKLPQGFKNKWINALRSGSYTRGTKMMFNPQNQTYDPLGVAHRIAGVSHIDIANEDAPTKTHRFLPNMLVNDEELVNKIISFNDKGMSFKWMASYIENNL
jgi:hypothetical protein